MARNVDGEIDEIWADTGDTATPPVTFVEGWDITYSQTGGPKPERTSLNFLLKQLYAMGADISQFGGGLPYSQTVDFLPDGIVTEAGAFYICLLANGPGSAVKVPGIAGSETFWALIDGDVIGPALSTDDAAARFDGLTGKLLANSGLLFTADGLNAALGTTPTAITRMILRALTNDTSTVALLCESLDGTDLFVVRGDGVINTGAQTNSPINAPIATTAPNVVIDAAGRMITSTLGTIQAWCTFNMVTATILDSSNITSITDHGVGEFTVTASITMDTSTPHIQCATGNATTLAAPSTTIAINGVTSTTARVTTTNTAGTLVDKNYCTVAFIGNLA